MSDSWVAIDFETSSARGTPCAVGLAEVEGGQVARRHSWLIRPPIFEFSPFNVALHGITPEMCEGAPVWPDSLAEILSIAAGRLLVAHNAGFDLGVIRDACDLCGIDWPALSYVCTLVVSRRAWPGLSSHSLPFVAAHLELEEGDHHDPVQDATMCAGIALAALEERGAPSLQGLAEGLEFTIGTIDARQWRGCHGKYGRAALPDSPRPGAHPQSGHALFDKSVAFTGALAVPRREAQQAVVDCGGRVTRGVTKETEILVTGFQDLSKLAAGASKSAKLAKAERLSSSGQSLDILSEGDFVQLLNSTDASEVEGGLKSSP